MLPFLAGLLGFAGSAAGQTLIGAGSTLLGAALSKPKTSYQVPDYAGIRAAAEAAGFNPLTALMAAPGQAVTSQNYMGQAIADAGMMVADALAKRGGSGNVSRLQQANAKLARKVRDLTLRPKVGGIYAQREAVPSLRAALGVRDGQGSAPSGGSVGVRPSAHGVVRGGAPVGVTADLPPLLDVSAVDPRRAVDNLPVTSDPGAIVIDNPHLGPPFPVPAVNGEVLDLGQAIVTGIAFAYDRFKGRSLFEDAALGMIDIDRRSREWFAHKFGTVAPKRQRGRGDYGMPRRRQTAMGWAPY